MGTESSPDGDGVRIERAGPEALEELVPLFDAYRQFYGRPADLPAAREFLGSRLRAGESVVFLALERARGVGFAQLYPLFSSTQLGRLWLLNDLYVAAAARRHGIGGRLLGRCQQFAIDSGAVGILLETAVDNPAQHLYEAHGWTVDREFRHYEWHRPGVRG